MYARGRARSLECNSLDCTDEYGPGGLTTGKAMLRSRWTAVKFLYRHPGWSWLVTVVQVVVGIILVCVAMIIVGAIMIGIVFFMFNVLKIGIKELVCGIVVIVAIFSYMIGVAKGRQE